MEATVSDPLVGRTIDGRYAVEQRIARGGMATVYLATDTRLDREVALKVMHPHLADDEQFVARFHREAKSAARLNHPNVVSVFDQGSDAGPSGNAVYLAMEHMPGRTLRDLLHERGPLTPREAFTVLEPVLDALAAAHHAGIVHRDVKPENVLLGDDGRVKVADFGLARAASTASTSTGVLMGTVAYLCPELVTRGVADARGDVYAAGVLLFEMVTGRQPFEGDIPIQVAYRHVHEEMAAPSDLVPELPSSIDDLVARATARDPDDRPRDAAAFLTLVRGVRAELARLDARALDHRPSAPMTGTPDGRTLVVRLPHGAVEHDTSEVDVDLRDGDPPRRRRRRLLAALLAVLATAALAAAGAWWFTQGPGATVATPQLVNQPRAEAIAVLREQGLVADPADVFSDDVPAGLVVATDPGAGEPVRKGGTVDLLVSQGPDVVVVPPLAGQTQDAATAAVEAADLQVGAVEPAFDESVPAGSVIESTPAEGAEHGRGEPVDLVVSQGPRPIDVPQVRGESREDAVAALSDARLEAQLVEESSDDVPAGVVASQSPDSGTLLPGETVRLVISTGPPLVGVPDVVRMQVDEAVAALEDLGFDVEVNAPLGRFFNTVRSQDPGGGTQVPRGATITLTVV